MPHYYAASGTPIQLDEVADSIGVRFEGETGPAVARSAVRAMTPAPKRTRAVADTERRAPTTAVQHFGRFMLLRESRPAERRWRLSATPRDLCRSYDARVCRARIKAQTCRDRTDPAVVQASRLSRAHAKAAEGPLWLHLQFDRSVRLQALMRCCKRVARIQCRSPRHRGR